MTFWINLILAAVVALYAWVLSILLKIDGPKKEAKFYKLVNVQYNLRTNDLDLPVLSILTRFTMECLWCSALFNLFGGLISNNYILYAGIVVFRIMWVTAAQFIFLKRRSYSLFITHNL